MDDATLRSIIVAQQSATIALQRQVLEVKRTSPELDTELMDEQFEVVMKQLSLIRELLGASTLKGLLG